MSFHRCDGCPIKVQTLPWIVGGRGRKPAKEWLVRGKAMDIGKLRKDRNGRDCPNQI